MSQESRSLIEALIQRDLVHTVCGTTTLAQGVNFPISNVLVEDRRKGSRSHLSYSDFWNIAGRAGRTMMDGLGVVAFPVAKAHSRDEWQAFLRGEATEIASQLSELLTTADDLIQDGIRIGDVRQHPVLSDMLQFLAHAMRVSGARQAAADLEDLLRSSLVYRQAAMQGDEQASRLIRLCRMYIDSIADRPGLAALSDQTGFSTPSIGWVLQEAAGKPTISDETEWQPHVLFGGDLDPLVERMRVLGGVPELGLGYEQAGSFSPYRAAAIVSDWVNGSSVADLASEYGGDKGDVHKRLANFARYLFGDLTFKASWGLGALETAFLTTGASDEESNSGTSRYVPSMVYFGVPTKEAVWMRMVGVPRLAAEGAGAAWSSENDEPRSYSELRDWVTGLDEQAWRTVLPASPLSGEEMHLLWSEALA